MLGRDGKVNLHLAPGGGVLRPFDQMLFDGFAHLDVYKRQALYSIL